jgi:hypothetical protein
MVEDLRPSAGGSFALTLTLPHEFVELCARNKAEPAAVRPGAGKARLQPAQCFRLAQPLSFKSKALGPRTADPLRNQWDGNLSRE